MLCTWDVSPGKKEELSRITFLVLYLFWSSPYSNIVGISLVFYSPEKRRLSKEKKLVGIYRATKSSKARTL
jgi:hypothetical protein